jgi:hypothetical protein
MGSDYNDPENIYSYNVTFKNITTNSHANHFLKNVAYLPVSLLHTLYTATVDSYYQPLYIMYK